MNITIPDVFLGKRIYPLEDEEITLNVENVSEYAEIPEFENPKGFEKFPSGEEWFDDLATDRVRLYNLNGINIANEPNDGECDYCGWGINNDVLYHCNECQLTMCGKCFPEKTEEIAVRLGAKNYAKRKDALEKCFSHSESLEKIPTLTECGFCKATSAVMIGEWTKSIKDPSRGLCEVCFGKTKSLKLSENIVNNRYCDFCCISNVKLHTDSTSNSDICEACHDDLMSSTKIEYTHSGRMYGSMLEWIPILRDEEQNILFINLAKTSPNFLKISLGSFDDHGRMGIYIVSGGLSEVLERLTEIYKDFLEKYSPEENSWEKHYSSPICKYLRNSNHKYILGEF